jgi:hypothetical protein
MSYYPNVYASQTGPLLLSGLDANFNFAVDIQSQSLYAAAGGSSDIITSTFTPAVTALVSGLTLYVRAATANTTTTPTFSPNSLTAHTIVKLNNQALAVGDIAGAGHILILQYDATNSVWELVNPATSVSAVNFGISGNLAFTGTGNRITGDFSNATTSSRVLFQSSTTNGNTRMGVIPNGTAQISAINFYNNSDPANASVLSVLANSSETQLNSTLTGTGTYLPMTFYTGGSERMRLDTSGNLGVGTTSPSYKLDVTGTLHSTGQATFDNAVNFNTATLNYLYYNSAISFSQNGTGERMRIDSSGNVGIGTSSTGGYRVAIVGSAVSSIPLYLTTDAANSYVYSPNSMYIGSTGAYGISFVTNNVLRATIDSNGNLLVTNVAGLGYGTGAGGTVTQLTSRTTGVTLSKPTGAITMFSAAGSATAATFTVTNTLVAATDTIILNQKSGTNLYVFLVTAVAAGSFNITFYTTGGTATDAPVINFSIIKGVTV